MFQIVIAIVVGIAAGSQPIIGYNYGAGNKKRVKEIFKTMIIAELVVAVIVPLVLMLPRQFGIMGTFYSAPIADVISFITVVISIVYIWRELKDEGQVRPQFMQPESKAILIEGGKV